LYLGYKWGAFPAVTSLYELVLSLALCLRERSVLVMGLSPMGGLPILTFVALGSFVAPTFVAGMVGTFVASALIEPAPDVIGGFVAGLSALALVLGPLPNPQQNVFHDNLMKIGG
jgi:hypothetical protein